MIVALSILAFISAALAIRGYYSEQKSQIYIFKPLTMIFIIALACLNSFSAFYAQAIFAGLIFSIVGDVLLIFERRFTQGLVSFLIAHVCYIVAFYHSRLSIPLACLFLAYSILFLGILWSALGKMKIPVTIYALVIAAMGWFAVSRWFQDSQFDKLLAASGAMFFIAYNKFKNSFKSSQFFVLSTYFLAQWLIALSVLFF